MNEIEYNRNEETENPGGIPGFSRFNAKYQIR